MFVCVPLRSSLWGLVFHGLHLAKKCTSALVVGWGTPWWCVSMICLLWHRISMPSSLIEARLFFFFHENKMIYWEIFFVIHSYSIDFPIYRPTTAGFPRNSRPLLGRTSWREKSQVRLSCREADLQIAPVALRCHSAQTGEGPPEEINLLHR